MAVIPWLTTDEISFINRIASKKNGLDLLLIYRETALKRKWDFGDRQLKKIFSHLDSIIRAKQFIENRKKGT